MEVEAEEIATAIDKMMITAEVTDMMIDVTVGEIEEMITEIEEIMAEVIEVDKVIETEAMTTETGMMIEIVEAETK